jgi:hypothetical protein
VACVEHHTNTLGPGIPDVPHQWKRSETSANLNQV